MKKEIRRLVESELPEPFRTYWNSEDRLKRKYEFYNVEGELYIRNLEYDDAESNLLWHWTLDGCSGISCYMRDNGIKERRDLPYVALNGVYLFEVLPTDDYETSVRDPTTRETYVVHSG